MYTHHHTQHHTVGAVASRRRRRSALFGVAGPSQRHCREFDRARRLHLWHWFALGRSIHQRRPETGRHCVLLRPRSHLFCLHVRCYQNAQATADNSGGTASQSDDVAARPPVSTKVTMRAFDLFYFYLFIFVLFSTRHLFVCVSRVTNDMPNILYN